MAFIVGEDSDHDFTGHSRQDSDRDVEALVDYKQFYTGRSGGDSVKDIESKFVGIACCCCA